MSTLRKMIVPCLLVFIGTLGSASSALAAPQTLLEGSPSAVEFEGVEIHGGSTVSRRVAFRNGSSSQSASVSSVQTVSANPQDFVLTQDTCSGQTIEPEKSCEVEVRFQPGSKGEKSGTLELTESLGNVDVPLTGQGITGTLLPSPSSLTFQPTAPNQNQPTEQVTIEDAHAATQIDQSVEITGPDASSFSIAYENCGGSLLYRGNTCSEGIRFAPSSTGEKTAQLVIKSDAESGTLTIPLSGRGAEGPKFSVNTRQALLGDVLVGSSVAQTFVVTSTGDLPLRIQQAFVISGTPLMFPVASDTCDGKEIPEGESCAITIDFQPSSPGLKDASILLITETSAGVSSLGLEGNGVLPVVAPQPAVAVTSVASPVVAPVTPIVLPRLFSLPTYPRSIWVNTGIGATCPTTVALCSLRSVITTRASGARGRASRGAEGKTIGGARTTASVVVGSTASVLPGGQSSAVHARISPNGVALLRRRGRLKVSITVAIAAPGIATQTQTRTLTLNARAALR